MPVGELEARGVDRIELLAGDLVLAGDDLLEALGLHQADRGGELAHPQVEALDPVVGLAVVAEGARVLEQLLAVRDEHAALAGGDRLGRVEGVGAGVAPGTRPAAVPAGAVGVGAVLEQEDAVLAAVVGDPLDVEGDVAADVDDHRGARPVLLGLALEVLEGHAEVVAVAVDEDRLAARVDDGERRRHEGVGRAEDLLALDAGEVERREGRAGPAAGGDRAQAVQVGPRRLEAGGQVALGPALGQHDLVPELVQPGQVAAIKADRELAVVGRGQESGALEQRAPRTSAARAG